MISAGMAPVAAKPKVIAVRMNGAALIRKNLPTRVGEDRRVDRGNEGVVEREQLFHLISDVAGLVVHRPLLDGSFSEVQRLFADPSSDRLFFKYGLTRKEIEGCRIGDGTMQALLVVFDALQAKLAETKGLFSNPNMDSLFFKHLVTAEDIDLCDLPDEVKVVLKAAHKASLARPTSASIIMRDGRMVLARLADFADLSMEPALRPDSDVIEFVAGDVLKRAQALIDGDKPQLDGVIENHEAATARLAKDLSAPDCRIVNEKPEFSKLPFDFNASHAQFVLRFRRGAAPALKDVDLDSRLYPAVEPLQIHGAAVTINYGQEIFEGLKASRRKDGKIILSAPWLNGRRLADSARKLSMTPMELKLFLAAIIRVLEANEHLVPPYGEGEVYIRPVQCGTKPKMGVGPAGIETFVVTVTPVGPYYPAGPTKGIKLLAQTKFVRAAVGIPADAKTGGLYGMAMRADEEAHSRGCAGVVWLDAATKKYIEEVGTSNAWLLERNWRSLPLIRWLYRKNPNAGWTLATPKLTGTILPGTTRWKVIQLATRMGYQVEEGRISLRRFLRAVAAFSSGTAAVLTPIAHVVWGGDLTIKPVDHTIGDGQVHPRFTALYEELVATVRDERNMDLQWTMEADLDTFWARVPVQFKA